MTRTGPSQTFGACATKQSSSAVLERAPRELPEPSAPDDVLILEDFASQKNQHKMPRDALICRSRLRLHFVALAAQTPVTAA